jgi:Flp pilus assembly protein TadD
MLLLLFAGTFRRPTANGSAGLDAARCDTLPAPAAASDIPTYERCLAIDAGNAELLVELGRAYQSQARSGDAEATYRRGLAIDPRNSDLRVLLGELLLTRGDLAGARREAEEALRWRPNALAALRLARASGGDHVGTP